MIASYFHLKGNLLSFNSHKTFITFLLLREISLYAAGLTNPHICSAVGAREEGHEQEPGLWAGAEGTSAALTGVRKEPQVLEEEQEPQFLPHLPANISKNGEQCPEREKLQECNHNLLFPG